MDGRPCALFILDESACILSRCGEPQTRPAGCPGFRDGSYCAESIIGTCALSLAAMQASRSTPPAIGILSRRYSHGVLLDAGV